MELLEVSGAWGTPLLWEAEKGLRGAKLDTGEMGRRDGNRGKEQEGTGGAGTEPGQVKDGDRAGMAQGPRGTEGGMGWMVGGGGAERGTGSRAGLGKGEQAVQARIIWGHSMAPKGPMGNPGVGMSCQNPHFTLTCVLFPTAS